MKLLIIIIAVIMGMGMPVIVGSHFIQDPECSLLPVLFWFAMCWFNGVGLGVTACHLVDKIQ